MSKLLSIRTIMLVNQWLNGLFVLYLFIPSPYTLVACVLPVAFVGPWLNAVIIGYRTAVTPDHLVGRVSSVARNIALLAQPLGPLAAGLLLAAFSRAHHGARAGDHLRRRSRCSARSARRSATRPASTSSMPTPLWRNRDFMLLQSGQLLSTFGSNVSRIAYPLLTLAVTHSAAKAGYVGAVIFLPLLVFALPAGVAADRLDRRALMIASDVVGAASVGALAAIVITHRTTFWLILVVAFVDSAAGVFFRAGNSGAFRAVVPQSQLADASSVSMARGSVVLLSAPPIGGALFGIARSVPFLADAVSYAFSTVSLLLMRTRFQEERHPGARTDLREGLAFFWQIPFLRTTVAMIAVSNFASAGVPLTLIVLGEAAWHLE